MKADIFKSVFHIQSLSNQPLSFSLITFNLDPGTKLGREK